MPLHIELVDFKTKLMFQKLTWIEIKTDSNISKGDFRVYSKKRKKDVTREV